jgi:hypothetical protein
MHKQDEFFIMHKLIFTIKLINLINIESICYITYISFDSMMRIINLIVKTNLYIIKSLSHICTIKLAHFTYTSNLQFHGTLVS